MNKIPSKPFPDEWALRKRWLPILPTLETRYYTVSIWQGEHPTLKGIKVWWTGYVPTLALLLEICYGEGIREMLTRNEVTTLHGGTPTC